MKRIVSVLSPESVSMLLAEGVLRSKNVTLDKADVESVTITAFNDKDGSPEQYRLEIELKEKK